MITTEEFVTNWDGAVRLERRSGSDRSGALDGRHGDASPVGFPHRRVSLTPTATPGEARPSVDRWVPPWSTLGECRHLASGSPDWVLLRLARLTPTVHLVMPRRTPTDGFPHVRFSTCETLHTIHFLASPNNLLLNNHAKFSCAAGVGSHCLGLTTSFNKMW